MFNSNRAARDGAAMPQVPPQQGKRGLFSVFGSDVSIVGNVKASADLHIDGNVEGDVECGSLAQGADSRILGNVTADIARLAGTVEGAVRVRQLTIERTARITGDVEYETITIENGGNIDGRLKHVTRVEGEKVETPKPETLNGAAAGDA